ncbi:MAG: GNAT family N-acetyltransferase [Candidatus Dormibacteria bacterium]
MIGRTYSHLYRRGRLRRSARRVPIGSRSARSPSRRPEASQDARRRLCATFCLVDDIDPEGVIGYYTLAAGAVRLTGLPPEVRKRLPRYPDVPVYLLGRLAVHQDHQGRGLGAHLLRDALGRVVQQEIPAWAVIVDAIDLASAQFYQHMDLRPSPTNPYISC